MIRLMPMALAGLWPCAEFIIFGYVVGCREVDLQYVFEPASVGRGEDDSGSESLVSFGAIEVHELVKASIGRRRYVFSLRPVDEELSEHL